MTTLRLIQSPGFLELAEGVCLDELEKLPNTPNESVALTKNGEFLASEVAEKTIRGTFTLGAVIVISHKGEAVDDFQCADVTGDFLLLSPDGSEGDNAEAILARSELKLFIRSSPSLRKENPPE